MNYQCEIKKENLQKVLSVRTKSSMKELPNLIAEVYGDIMTYLISIGKSPAGVPFIGYFSMDMTNCDVEIGIPVGEDIPDNGRIKMSEIPAGDYAETLHVGPYNELENAYTALMNWTKEHHCYGTGIAYEYYLNDPGEVEASKLETKIMFQMK